MAAIIESENLVELFILVNEILNLHSSDCVLYSLLDDRTTFKF